MLKEQVGIWKSTERLRTFDPFRHSREQEIPSIADDLLLSVVESVTQEQQGCAGEIVRLKLIARQLEKEQVSRKQYLDACLCLTRPSPIRKLPNEILSQIFADIVNDDEIFLSYDRIYNATPLLLGKVSSHWRHVVLSTPVLFS